MCPFLSRFSPISANCTALGPTRIPRVLHDCSCSCSPHSPGPFDSRHQAHVYESYLLFSVMAPYPFPSKHFWIWNHICLCCLLIFCPPKEITIPARIRIYLVLPAISNGFHFPTPSMTAALFLILASLVIEKAHLSVLLIYMFYFYWMWTFFSYTRSTSVSHSVNCLVTSFTHFLGRFLWFSDDFQ